MDVDATSTEARPRRRTDGFSASPAGCRFVAGADLWVLSDDDEIPLHRLLDRAKACLAEAATLAALVLEAVADLHDAGAVHGSLDNSTARVDREGNVRLDPGRTPRGGSAVRDARRADLRAVATVVAEIAQSAGRPARPLTAAEERMAARLASAADPRNLVRRDPRKAALGLHRSLGSAERRDAARQGLSALIGAVADADAPSASGAHGISGPDDTASLNAGPAGSAAAPPARRLPPPARRPPIWPRVWKGAVAAVVVALVLGVELRFFGASVQRNVHVLLSGDVRPAVAAAPRRPAPLPVLGPAVAPPITHLEVRPLDGCRPESVCNAVVQVTVAPQDRPLDVAWAFELVDRCRSGREPRPGGVLQVPPGRDRAVQTVTLPLPAGRALALIPVTSSPVLVAGTPMRLSPDNGPC